MRKKLQLHIPTSCHENWDNMTPVEKGRFCGSCQKQVVDFTNMSDREIATFFKKPSTGSVCGRFMQDQLNRDIEIPKKRIPWVKYFFQIVLPAFLVSARATAQGKVVPKHDVTTCEKTKEPENLFPLNVSRTVGDTTILPEVVVQSQNRIACRKVNTGMTITSVNVLNQVDSTSICGIIHDDKDEPVPFSTINIKGTTNAVKADVNGEFNIIPEKDWNRVSLEINSIGYISKEIEVYRENKKGVVDLGIINVQSDIMGFTYVIIESSVPSLPFFSKPPKDNSPNGFKLFPNPVKSGSTLNIEWKNSETGDLKFELFNLSGQLFFSKEIWIDEKTRFFNLGIPRVTAGNYFLRATNKKSGKVFSEKIIIQ